jgi:hypothetical protein
MSCSNFLRRWLFTKERFGVLWTRGGLGNQLFQITALAFFSKKLFFSPIVAPSNLRKSRDNFFPQYRNLGIEEIYWSRNDKVDPTRTLELVLSLLYRIFSRFFPNKIFSESQITNSTILPKLFFIQDYFETREYPDRMSEDSLFRLIATLEEAALFHETNFGSKNHATAVIHVRLTDSIKSLDPTKRLSKLQTVVNNLGIAEHIIFDVFSDDIILAKEILQDFFSSTTKRYPEEFLKLSPIALLGSLLKYDVIIASKSTLCWWACYLRSRMSKVPATIVADFSPRLMRDDWLNSE